MTAPNPGPYTFQGTNTYLIGDEELAVLDPGPNIDAHYDAIMQIIGHRPVTHIFLTHTHTDHSPLAPRLQAATGARTLAEGPHRLSRPLHRGEINPVEAAADLDFIPDRRVADLECVEGKDWALRTILTPGHCANHACFALEGTGVLFSGDHVMGWSTSVIAPPDGNLADYMASLKKLQSRNDQTYLPGHGGLISDPKPMVASIIAHRDMRERQILNGIERGSRLIKTIAKQIYPDIDPKLETAAALSILAHIEVLVEKGQVISDRDVSLEAEYRPA